MNELLHWINSYQDNVANIKKQGLNLYSIKKIASKLGLKKINVPVITVAGTNGKGSCILTMESILLAHGKNVGSYISPHLFSFNERIRLNGDNVTYDECFKAFSIVKRYSEKLQTQLSYFEFATLIALYVFKFNKLDVILLEVGLGGRLDATNIVNNDISIIVSISKDHTEILGDTREKIALEKCGIIKKNNLVVCSDYNPPKIIAKYCNKQEAKLYQIGSDFVLSKEPFSSTILSSSNLSFPKENAAAALMGVKLLFNNFYNEEIDILKVRNCLQNIKLPGRMQIIEHKGCKYIFDVAHNPAASMWLKDEINKRFINNDGRNDGGKIFVVIGVLRKKDLTGILQPWLELVNDWFCLSLSCKDSYLPEEIKLKLQKCKLNFKLDIKNDCIVTAYDHNVVIQLLSEKVGKKDLVVCFGSFHLVEIMLRSFRFDFNLA